MRPKAWQRLGIILSVVWAVGAGIHTHNTDVEHAEGFADHAYKVCSDSKLLAHDNDLSSCEQEREKNLNLFMEGNLGNVAFAARTALFVKSGITSTPYNNSGKRRSSPARHRRPHTPEHPANEGSKRRRQGVWLAGEASGSGNPSECLLIDGDERSVVTDAL